MRAARLLFHRWQPIFDMAGESKHSFAQPGTIYQGVEKLRLRP
jgi:hypothetical protein